MPLPERSTPTVRVAVVRLLVPLGSPAMEAPRGMTPPLSRPFGPVPRAGEPGKRLNQSRNTCAWSQVVKAVSDTCRMYLRRGLFVELPPPRLGQGYGIRLLVKVTMALVQLRTSF